MPNINRRKQATAKLSNIILNYMVINAHLVICKVNCKSEAEGKQLAQGSNTVARARFNSAIIQLCGKIESHCNSTTPPKIRLTINWSNAASVEAGGNMVYVIKNNILRELYTSVKITTYVLKNL